MKKKKPTNECPSDSDRPFKGIHSQKLFQRIGSDLAGIGELDNFLVVEEGQRRTDRSRSLFEDRNALFEGANFVTRQFREVFSFGAGAVLGR